MPSETRLQVVASDLCFGEGPRWHDGRLWFSDMHDHQVLAMSVDGTLERIVAVPTQPSGLGWLPDGTLLVVSMTDRRLLRMRAGGVLVEHADLSALAGWHCNDMVVDGQGRAYVGNFGFDLYSRPDQPVPAALILVEPDGRAQVVADDLAFPNGTVITADGSTLIVGESFGRCLTAFDIAADGALSGRRAWAPLTDATPDGICLDAEGAIWLASPLGHQVLRVAEGGKVLDRIETGERNAYACMLGGPERRTLYVCTARSSNPAKTVVQRAGCIEAADVEVPGAGWP